MRDSPTRRELTDLERRLRLVERAVWVVLGLSWGLTIVLRLVN